MPKPGISSVCSSCSSRSTILCMLNCRIDHVLLKQHMRSYSNFHKTDINILPLKKKIFYTCQFLYFSLLRNLMRVSQWCTETVIAIKLNTLCQHRTNAYIEKQHFFPIQIYHWRELWNYLDIRITQQLFWSNKWNVLWH